MEGLYGSITQSGMQKVLDCLRHNAALDRSSVFVDVGAGLGRCVLGSRQGCLTAQPG